jgi:SAM-dependent methyltransferase
MKCTIEPGRSGRMSDVKVDTVWEDPERVEEFARKRPDHRLVALIEAEADPRRLRALDVGCAGGRNAVFLAERGVDVVATDGSAAMVERTRERLAAILGPEEAARRVIRSSMEVAPGIDDGSIDLVVALGIYHNARGAGEWQAALGETARVLRGGGRALVSVFTPQTDLDGRGHTPVPGVPHLYERPDGRRLYMVDLATLDRDMAAHGLDPLEPTTLAEGQVELGRRVSVNGLYRMRAAEG